MAAGAAIGALGAGSLLGSIVGRVINIAERLAGYEIATRVILPEYENLTLDKVVEAFVIDKKTRDELINLLNTNTGMRQTKAFVEFLKNFNLGIAKKSAIMGVVNPSWGHMTSQLLGAISWSFGFGWLSWVALSPILRSVISEPATSALEETFPTKYLSKADIEKLRRLGEIDIEKYREELRRLGYNDRAIAFYTILAQAERTQKERDLTKSELLRAYKKGLIDITTLRIQLKRLGYSEDEINILIELTEASSKLSKREERRELSRSLVLRAFRLGILSKEEALVRLRALGYTAEDAKLILETEEAKRKMDTRERDRDLTRTDILKAFELGIMSWDEAKQALMDLGYDESEADLLLTIRAMMVMRRGTGKVTG